MWESGIWLRFFEGISLQGDSSHAESPVPSVTLPVQRTTLPPGYCSTTLASRSLGAGEPKCSMLGLKRSIRSFIYSQVDNELSTTTHPLIQE